MLTQYEEIKKVWMNALTQFRVEELLLHFPPGKFGFAEDADMTPIEGVMRFIESVKKARTDLATMTVSAPTETPTEDTANDEA